MSVFNRVGMTNILDALQQKDGDDICPQDGNASNNKQMKELICSKPLTFDVWGKIIDKLNNVFKGKFPFWVAFLVSFCRLGAAAIVKRFATIFLLVGIQIAWFATIIK